MTGRNDWDRWGADWRTPAPELVPGAVALALDRARRAMARSRIVEMVVTIGAVAILAGAVMHAANPAEAMSALGVGAAITAVWVRRLIDRRDEAQALMAPSDAFDDIARRLLRRELALARFALLVVALLLVFLVPWWVSGLREHSSAEAFMPVVIWTTWVPLVAIAALATWAFRARRLALRGLRMSTTTDDFEPRS